MKTPNKRPTNKTKTAEREAYRHMPRRSGHVTGQVVALIVRDPTIAPKDTQTAASKQDQGEDAVPRFFHQNRKFWRTSKVGDLVEATNIQFGGNRDCALTLTGVDRA